MPRIRCAWLSLVVLAAAPGQAEPAAFADQLDRALKKHPFFTKMDFTVAASHPFDPTTLREPYVTTVLAGLWP
jgi:hypothetical protein